MSPPRITIDLSEPAESRWDSVLSAPGVNASLWAALAEIGTLKSEYGVLLDLVGKFPWSDLHGWLPGGQLAEVQGIARLTKIPVGTLFAINALYDATASKTVHNAACTSIVVEDAAGHISHGRNLDYSLAPAMLNITRVVDFLSASGDGSVAFTSVGYLGQVGFNTVVKHGSWALSQDERDQGSITSDWWDMFVRRRVLTFSFIRQLAEEAPTFDAAVERAMHAGLSAPSYLIFSGMRSGEGVVLSRGRDGSNATDIVKLNAAAGKWYLLETNYDHNDPTDPKDNRRAVATRALERLGQEGGASIAGLLSVLGDNAHCNATRGERPVLNSHTVYTAAYSAADAKALEVILRDPLTVNACVE